MRRPTILSVEDSEDDCLFIQWAFPSATVDLVHVDSAEAAVEHLSKVRSDPGQFPTLILTDLKLPGMSGFELMRWVREQPEFSDIPMGVLSGSDLPEDKARALELGA